MAVATKAATSPLQVISIDLSKPRYDQSTYLGRVRHFMGVIDPLTLLTTDAKLKESLQLIDTYQKRLPLPAATTEEHLWKAKQIQDAVIHPDTKEKVFAPFRMAAFVPVNIPIVVGMMNARTVPATLFWQWFNQSYNVAVNYANRNASSTMSTQAIMTSYGAACFTSCALAVGLGKVTEAVAGPKSTLPNIFKYSLRTIVPYTAVASAGAMNVALMRWNEIQAGIHVQDRDGTQLGLSTACGKKAIMETVLTRLALPAPILILPKVIMSSFDMWSVVKSNPRLRAPIEVAVVTACLWGCLPGAIGLFPQQSSAHVSTLEPRFRSLKTKDGKPVEYVYFNKGL